MMFHIYKLLQDIQASRSTSLCLHHCLANSRTSQDLTLRLPGLSRTKLIFQEFPGPGNFTSSIPGLSRRRGNPVYPSLFRYEIARCLNNTDLWQTDRQTDNTQTWHSADLSWFSSWLASSRNRAGSSGEKKPLAISSMHCFSSMLDS